MDGSPSSDTASQPSGLNSGFSQFLTWFVDQTQEESVQISISFCPLREAGRAPLRCDFNGYCRRACNRKPAGLAPPSSGALSVLSFAAGGSLTAFTAKVFVPFSKNLPMFTTSG